MFSSKLRLRMCIPYMGPIKYTISKKVDPKQGCVAGCVSHSSSSRFALRPTAPSGLPELACAVVSARRRVHLPAPQQPRSLTFFVSVVGHRRRAAPISPHQRICFALRGRAGPLHPPAPAPSPAVALLHQIVAAPIAAGRSLVGLHQRWKAREEAAAGEAKWRGRTGRPCGIVGGAGGCGGAGGSGRRGRSMSSGSSFARRHFFGLVDGGVRARHC
jgi:hypothetical protein